MKSLQNEVIGEWSQKRERAQWKNEKGALPGKEVPLFF